MMVTFVSRCEKKALTRTRRVLDAFADRIGDNTWQAVITQEGLLAVKKLLRKTATKNTAVSCHWIRSRSRSELVWVVGSKNRFNHHGIVPVNTTQKEVPMDILINKPVKGVVYANTHLQPLDQHLFAVGYVAELLYQRYYPDDPHGSTSAFIAGCFHDIGKVDPEFQKWATKEKNKVYIAEDGQHIDEAKFSFEKHPRHNEISLAIYWLLDDSSLKSINGENKKRIKHAIYWHHARPIRSEGVFETIGDIYSVLDKNLNKGAWKQVVEKGMRLLENVAKLDAEYRIADESMLNRCITSTPDTEKMWDIEATKVPDYKEYRPDDRLENYKNQIVSNALNNQLRACLITADRWISAMSAIDLAGAIKQKNLDSFINEQIEKAGLQPESMLEANINNCLSEFTDNERSQQQAAVAEKLAQNSDHVGVLAGAAGCGKTKIALEWAKLRNARQILWVCPRVQICQGLFADLSSSDDPYLPEANVELHTGEFKFMNTDGNETPEDDYFSGDIVITTIDQILNTVISHSKADRLLNYLSIHVVFDEYHEYINMPAFNLLFAELLASRDGLADGCNTLLVSATPHYLYLEEILGLDREYDVVEMSSFNPCKYQFSFLPYDENREDAHNPLYEKQSSGTFVISNRAITAQKSFIKNQNSENAILLHSKFKKSDKKALSTAVFEAFKRYGCQLYDVLRSGPIVQASLNISCQKMVSDFCSAENTLQRLGRLDRFGENTQGVNSYTVAIPETLEAGKRQGSLARFMSSTNVLSSALAWYGFLNEATEEGKKQVNLPELYSLYSKFYETPAALKVLEQDLIAAMKKSTQIIADKAAEPKVLVKPKQGQKQRAKISKSSLRGDSRFVQMAVCDVNDPLNPKPQNEYAYDIPASENDPVDNLTESLGRIKNCGLLDYLAQKHGRIDETSSVKRIPATRMLSRQAVLEGYARDPEYPLFLSYTPHELDQKLGERVAHPEATYYAVCEKQAVGAISIKQLINREN
jgi:CRISPR-associated endonuclease/helicase Cas3